MTETPDMQQTRQNDVDASPSSLLDAKLMITAIHASSSLGLEACIVWWIRCCCCPKRSRHPASSSSAACSSAASKRNLQKKRPEKVESARLSPTPEGLDACATGNHQERIHRASLSPKFSFQNGFN